MIHDIDEDWSTSHNKQLVLQKLRCGNPKNYSVRKNITVEQPRENGGIRREQRGSK